MMNLFEDESRSVSVVSSLCIQATIEQNPRSVKMIEDMKNAPIYFLSKHLNDEGEVLRNHCDRAR